VLFPPPCRPGQWHPEDIASSAFFPASNVGDAINANDNLCLSFWHSRDDQCAKTHLIILGEAAFTFGPRD
jgi:hypothetical protein